MTTHLSGFIGTFAAASFLAIAGCSAAVEAPADYTVAVGQQLDITLGIGPDSGCTTAMSFPRRSFAYLGGEADVGADHPGRRHPDIQLRRSEAGSRHAHLPPLRHHTRKQQGRRRRGPVIVVG